jgi:hypothetical protein
MQRLGFGLVFESESLKKLRLGVRIFSIKTRVGLGFGLKREIENSAAEYTKMRNIGKMTLKSGFFFSNF